MKFELMFLAAVLGSGHALGQPGPRPMRDSVNHEELVLKYKQATSQDIYKTHQMLPLTGKDPTKENQPGDLISRSDIICFNGLTTLVPKKSIITVPKNYEGRLKHIPGSKLVSWKEFYESNRGWITTVEITRQQAAGVSSLNEETSKRVSLSKNLMVATLHGGPISLLPPTDPVEGAPESTTPIANPKL